MRRSGRDERPRGPELIESGLRAGCQPVVRFLYGAHLRLDRQQAGLTQPPILGGVLGPALDKRQVEHEAAARLGALLHVVHVRRAEHVGLHGVHLARAVAVEDHAPVGARVPQRVKLAEAFGKLARGPHGAHQLVERQLVVDLRVTLDRVHHVAPLERDVHRVLRRAEEHHARVEPRRPLGARLVAAVLHAGAPLRAVGVERHVQAVGPREHVRLRHRAQQRVRRSNPRGVDVGHANVAAGAQHPQDHLRLGDAVRAEGARLPSEAVHAALVLRVEADAAKGLRRHRRQLALRKHVEARAVERREDRPVAMPKLFEHRYDEQRPVDRELAIRRVGERDECELALGHAAQH
eukprot:6040150-Prymnesium_polylepis.1